LQLGKIDGIAKGLDNTTPLCISIAIVHVDASGAESDQMTVSAFPAQVFAPDNVPHLKNQFVIDQFGQVMINTQDSYDEIADSVGIVVGTEVGQRPMVPSFGVQDLPLTQIDTAAVEQAIQYWEPRANANVTVRYDENNNAALSVQINPGV
jgi:phage baseplate assembly protein W